MNDEMIYVIGSNLEREGLSHEEIDDYFLEHYGVKGMKWGVRRARATKVVDSGLRGGRKERLIRGGAQKEQSRKARNGKRVAAALLGGPPGLIAYNSLSAPLNAKSSAKMKTQSARMLAGKTVAVSLLTTPLGGLMYYQMSAKAPGYGLDKK